MTKYLIEWTEEAWFRMEVEASSEAEAKQKVALAEVDFSHAEVFGSEIQDSITAREIVNA